MRSSAQTTASDGGTRKPRPKVLVGLLALAVLFASVLGYLLMRPRAAPVTPAVVAPVVPQAVATVPMPAEWAPLTPAQRQALKPLAATWSSLHAQQKQKWIALSRSYARMSPAEQALLHSRMVEWAALTPAQRSQARLNFAVAKKLPAQDKSQKWEAYQALSPEEKQKLADSATTVKSGGAAAVQPVASDKLTALPPPKPSASDSEQEVTVRQPKINTSPDQVDPETLLPQLP